MLVLLGPITHTVLVHCSFKHSNFYLPVFRQKHYKDKTINVLFYQLYYYCKKYNQSEINACNTSQKSWDMVLKTKKVVKYNHTIKEASRKGLVLYRQSSPFSFA